MGGFTHTCWLQIIFIEARHRIGGGKRGESHVPVAAGYGRASASSLTALGRSFR